MRELEIAILIVVSFLLLISVLNMSLSSRKHKHVGYNYNKFRSSQNASPAPGLEGYEAGDIQSTVQDTDWQQEINKIGVDPATKFSHKEWTSELLGRTTGASPWTVRDDDIDSNWLGLRWGNTWKYVYAQPGARVSESNDWQDMPSDAALRWRCHSYIGNKVTPSTCPWPPNTDMRFS